MIYTFYYSRLFDAKPLVQSVEAKSLNEATVLIGTTVNTRNHALEFYTEFDGGKLEMHSGKQTWLLQPQS